MKRSIEQRYENSDFPSGYGHSYARGQGLGTVLQKNRAAGERYFNAGMIEYNNIAGLLIQSFLLQGRS
jgi:hypothetical protein